jgi:hypothetical protein
VIFLLQAGVLVIVGAAGWLAAGRAGWR